MNQLAVSDGTVSKTAAVSKNLDETLAVSDGTVSKTSAVSKNLDESIGLSDGTVSKTWNQLASVMALYQRHLL